MPVGGPCSVWKGPGRENLGPWRSSPKQLGLYASGERDVEGLNVEI